MLSRIDSTISPNTSLAYHELFDLKEAYQNLGIGKDINRARIVYYRQLGLWRVELEASD